MSLTNCLFYGNQAFEGGAVVTTDGTTVYRNCTFDQNEATLRWGGAVSVNNVSKFFNSIFWGNTAAEGDPAIFDGFDLDPFAVVEYCDVQGGWPGSGNLDVDPQFVDLVAFNFKLASSSPVAAYAASTARSSCLCAGLGRSREGRYHSAQLA